MRRSATVKMSARSIESLRGPPAGSSSPSREYTCAQQKCLVLAVFANGSKSWRLKTKLRGRRISYTIGAYLTWSVEQAIERAREMLRQVDLGIDPRVQTQQVEEVTVGEFVKEHFLPHVMAHYKSAGNAKNMLNKRIVPHFGNQRLSEVQKKDVAAFLRSLAEEVSGTTANRYQALLSSLFKYAIELELTENNPCRGIKKAQENRSRDRFLHSDEFERFIQTLQTKLDKPAYQALFLLIATGLRKGELLKLRWEDVNLADGTLYLQDPKNGESRFAPVNSVALDLLTKMQKKRRRACPWLFPSKTAKKGHLVDIRKAFKSVCTTAQLKNLRPHDLRRSHAVQLLNAGVDHLIIKDLLGHKSLKSTMVYARVATSSLAKSSEIAAEKIRGAMNG